MDIRAVLVGLAFALMWSSAFTSARIIVADASPLMALSARYLISGLIGVGIALAMGQTWRLTKGQWRATIVFGILQNAVYLGLNFVAMQTVQASLAAIIASTMPLLVGLATWIFLGERLKPLGIAGLVAGVIGVTIIMGARISGGVDLIGLMLCGIGALALFQHGSTFLGLSGCEATVLIGSFGATASLVFGAPAVPFSQPRNVVGGHFVSALTGVCAHQLCGMTAPELACPLAVGGAVVAMQQLRYMRQHASRPKRTAMPAANTCQCTLQVPSR